MADRPFQMHDNDRAKRALRHWLKERSHFNAYSIRPMKGCAAIIFLTVESHPERDFSRLLSRSGKIVCYHDDDGGMKASDAAEIIVRQHLGWLAVEQTSNANQQGKAETVSA